MINKFKNFVNALQLEPKLESAILSGFNLIFESVISVGGNFVGNEGFVPTVFKSEWADKNNGAMYKKIIEESKKRFAGFLDKLNDNEKVNAVIYEGVEAITEAMDWLTSDASLSSMNGGSGPFIDQVSLGGSNSRVGNVERNRPMADNIYKSVGMSQGLSTSDAAPNDNTPAVGRSTRDTAEETRDDWKTYKYPSLKYKSDKDIMKIIDKNSNKIKRPGMSESPYSPTFNHVDGFNPLGFFIQ